MNAKYTCKYCPNEYHYHRILTHIMKQHKEAFLLDKDNAEPLTTWYNKKQGISKAVIQKGGDQVWCCFGCMNLFNKEFYKDKHLINHKNCKERHNQFVEENHSTFYKSPHGKTIADDKALISNAETNPELKDLLEKVKNLEKECKRLTVREQFLNKRVSELQAEKVELRNNQSAFQEIVDDELSPQMRKTFKSIMAKKSPEIFKNLYDEMAYEVSIESDSSSETSSESSIEDNEEQEERNSFKEAIEEIKAPREEIKAPSLYTGRPQKQYKIYHAGDEVVFIDEDRILYDKDTRIPGNYIKCGYVDSGGQYHWE